jgi:uncharacterized Ntn-hydrolase superfamily protein
VLAVQSMPEPGSAEKALDLLRQGLDPEAVVEKLHADDPGASVRQVTIVDANGRTAAHTGSDCIREAGHRIGDGFACAATMMISATVPEAMAAAYEAARGPLPERLLAALDAAEAEGGDLRGRQSAVLLVIGRRKIDLRVDDHPDPLGELRRLQTLDRAYALVGEAEELVAEGRHDDAARRIDEALTLAPGSDELLFWAAIASAAADDHLEQGTERLRKAAALNPRWLELLDRLDPSTIPGAAELRTAIHEHERSRSG